MKYNKEEESNCTTHFLDQEISGADNGIEPGVCHKPVEADITIHNTSNNPKHKKNKRM
jgi:hypothetical protein